MEEVSVLFLYGFEESVKVLFSFAFKIAIKKKVTKICLSQKIQTTSTADKVEMV